MTGPLPLDEALERLGRDPAARELVVAACRALESLPEHAHSLIREEVTGPIVDVLHRQTGPVTKELSNGLVLEFLYRSKIARDFVLAAAERPDHVWEPQTTKAALHLARGARHVVVGGAYFGDQAVLLAHGLKAQGGVCHAFEPDADQAGMLARNADRNDLPNLRVNALALWDEDGARLRLDGADALASSAPATDADAAVPATTLDAYLDRAGIDAVQLILLDLEGAELAALRGAERLLAQPAPRAPHLVFEVHRSYVDWSQGLPSTDIVRYLAGHGYETFAIRDFQSNRDLGDRPIELVPPETAHLDGPPHGFNVLAVKDRAVLDTDAFVFTPGVSPKLLAHREPALHHPAGGL